MAVRTDRLRSWTSSTPCSHAINLAAASVMEFGGTTMDLASSTGYQGARRRIYSYTVENITHRCRSGVRTLGVLTPEKNGL